MQVKENIIALLGTYVRRFWVCLHPQLRDGEERAATLVGHDVTKGIKERVTKSKKRACAAVCPTLPILPYIVVRLEASEPTSPGINNNARKAMGPKSSTMLFDMCHTKNKVKFMFLAVIGKIQGVIYKHISPF